MKGRIIRGIGGFYYVDTSSMGVLECKAKGVFRNKKIKPLVGDNVEIAVVDVHNCSLGFISRTLQDNVSFSILRKSDVDDFSVFECDISCFYSNCNNCFYNRSYTKICMIIIYI